MQLTAIFICDLQKPMFAKMPGNLFPVEIFEKG